jgi:hypothetical protein
MGVLHSHGFDTHSECVIVARKNPDVIAQTCDMQNCLSVGSCFIFFGQECNMGYHYIDPKMTGHFEVETKWLLW